MKKVLLTKSQHKVPLNISKCVGTEAITKKKMQVVPVKNLTTVQVTNLTKVPEKIYEERKTHQNLYQELFSVLFRMPDKVQQRVINAINGKDDEANRICKQCSRSINRNNDTVAKFVDASTQTEIKQQQCDDIIKHAIKKPTNSHIQINIRTTTGSVINDKNLPTINSSSVHSNALANNKTTEDESSKPAVKRGRKRKTCVPQVVKRSHAQQVMQEREDKQLTPLVMKKKRIDKPTTSEVQKSPLYSLDTGPNLFDDLTNLTIPDNILDYDFSGDNLLDTMAWEYLSALRRTDGLLPIHDSVLNNDIHKLQRQIFVLTNFHKVDLNELVTDEDEDCLELSILNDCIPSITETLLKANLSPNHIYEHSNNVIHLAIINSTEDNCLLELMERIDLKLLLLRNDDGYTPIHVALRHNNFRGAEIICNVIDKRILGAPSYNRIEKPKDRIENDVNTKDEKHFCKFYEVTCEKLDDDGKNHDFSKINFKRQLLDMGETRGGNTALFYAIENDMKHFSYFLLAHFSNPNVENHSGQSAKSFHYEFARTLHLNLKVARTLDKIAYLLDPKSFICQ